VNVENGTEKYASIGAAVIRMIVEKLLVVIFYIVTFSKLFNILFDILLLKNIFGGISDELRFKY